jgi:hypothetical protein
MCVDYTDLNKHCPKDPFGLSRIDQVIDSTAGCDLLCFLDCYSRPRSRKKTRRRPHSTPRLAHTATRPCPSCWRYIPMCYPGLLQEATQQERRSLRG